jgi:plastocyanin
MSSMKPHQPKRSHMVLRTVAQFAVNTYRTASKITLFALLAVGPLAASAGELSVAVVDTAGKGVPDTVVTVTPLEMKTPPPGRSLATAVMDQQHLAFVPRVLVVAAGTTVEFPNNDSVSHQVYSFSPAKKFQLPLYKGQLHPPVVFDHGGLVVLGCNIHDQMVGYIYVTPAPYFGKTDASGALRLPDLKSGDYRLIAWSPLIADLASTLERTVHIDTGEAHAERIQLKQSLRPRPEPRPHRGDWEY